MLVPSLFLVPGLVLLSGCGDRKPGRAQSVAKTVEVSIVERQPVKVSRIISGTLEAIQKVDIYNEEPGRIKQLPFYEGDSVANDALLVELDGSLIEAQLDKANASLNQAKLDLRRLKKLAPSNLASQDELARAQTALEENTAEVRLLKTRLAHTRIRAPFAGKISARLKEPGDVVATNSHILSLINPAALKAKMYVSALLLGRLQKDDPVSLRIDALGDTRFPARILRVHPVIDPVSRQGVVEVRLDPVPAGALPGQLCRLYLSSETTPLRTIPLAALRHDAQGEYVYRVEQDMSRYTPVKTGLQLNERVEILDGLKQGDKVIVKGIIGLRDGNKVRIANTAQGAVSAAGLPPPAPLPRQADGPAKQKGP